MKTCKLCMYYRTQIVQAEGMPQGPWCSNSKSPFYFKVVKAEDTCGAFERRKGKALTQRFGAVVKKVVK
jgi:hypothetical protein